MGPVIIRKKGSQRSPFFSYITIWLTLFIIAHNTIGQNVIIPGNAMYNDTSGGLIADLPTKLDSSAGEVYWFNLPQKSNLCLLNGDSILNIKVNIRLDQASIEIYDGTDIRVLPLGLTRSISIDTNVFVTHNYFDIHYDLSRGYYQILIEGNYSLIAHLTYDVQRQNYNAQFDVGNTKAKAYKVVSYLIIRSDFKILNLADTRKKIACKFFNDPQLSMDYLKKNKVRLKNADDLVNWVTYENRINR